jgi:hypothetical protein
MEETYGPKHLPSSPSAPFHPHVASPSFPLLSPHIHIRLASLPRCPPSHPRLLSCPLQAPRSAPHVQHEQGSAPGEGGLNSCSGPPASSSWPEPPRHNGLRDAWALWAFLLVVSLVVCVGVSYGLPLVGLWEKTLVEEGEQWARYPPTHPHTQPYPPQSPTPHHLLFASSTWPQTGMGVHAHATTPQRATQRAPHVCVCLMGDEPS